MRAMPWEVSSRRAHTPVSTVQDGCANSTYPTRARHLLGHRGFGPRIPSCSNRTGMMSLVTVDRWTPGSLAIRALDP
jgi:hypothetical protein